MTRINYFLKQGTLCLVVAVSASLLATSRALAQTNSHDQDEYEERLIEVMRAGVEQVTTPSTPHHENLDPLMKAYQLKSELEQKQSAYERSETELRQALEAAIDHIPSDELMTDFHFEREALFHLQQRTRQLANNAELLISRIHQHRRVGSIYLTALTNATPTYAALALQFRQYAAEEQYRDRREDYLVLASVFDQLGARFRTAPALVSADANAIDELYPYLKSTHLLLKRTYSVLSVLPADSHAAAGSGLDEQLRKFVNTFKGFRQEIRKLNERLGGQSANDSIDSQEPASPPVTNQSTDQIASYYFYSPAERPKPFEHRAVKSSYASYHQPPSTKHSAQLSHRQVPVADEPRTTPSAWTAAEHLLEKNILAFHLPGVSGNDMLRREVNSSSAVQEGELFSISLNTGRRITVEVKRRMPTLSSRYETVWLAEVVRANKP